MENKKSRRTGTIVNFILIALLAVVVFNKDAKSWVLRGLMSVGLFKAEIPTKKNAESSKSTAFTFTDAAGKTFSTSQLKGKVVFANFWASWCPPCLAEMPSLQSLYDQYKNDQRIVFLFINEDNDPKAGKTYLRKKGYTIPMARVDNSVPVEVYSGTLPTTVVLDKNGRMVMRHENVANYNTSSFIEQLESLMK